MCDEIEIGSLAGGGAVVAFCSYMGSREFGKKVSHGLPHDVWYTERNGDAITLVVPKGTLPERLPSKALGYLVMEWIVPENDFGTGVIPAAIKKKIDDFKRSRDEHRK